MAIELFQPRTEAIGTGLLDTYTFPFKITSLEHLIIMVTNASYVETFRVRGSDTTYIDSVTFDAVLGGGTVVLVDALPSGHFLTILQANDEPVQASEFKNKGSLTLSRLESALDALGLAVQRLTYRVSRSMQIGDSLVDSEPFDPLIPIFSTTVATQNNVDKVICVGDDNASFKIGPSTVDLAADAAAAAASAAAAATSESQAATSATNAATSATSAATSATDAATSATNAATSATSAATSATNAATSETNAATSATNAATSATTASTAATAAEASEDAAAASVITAASSEANAATSETNAATSETNAAASAAAAAASAASIAAPSVTGTRAAPSAVVGATGISFTGTSYNNLWFIQGSGGAVTVTAAARIAAGTNVGQRLTLIGRSGVNTVTMADGNGLSTGGATLIFGENSIVVFVFDGTNWVLESSNGLI